VPCWLKRLIQLCKLRQEMLLKAATCSGGMFKVKAPYGHQTIMAPLRRSSLGGYFQFCLGAVLQVGRKSSGHGFSKAYFSQKVA
jgi:hypothetical protein